MSSKKIRLEHEELFWKILNDVKKSSRFANSRKFIQHGSVSVYVHSIMVAYTSCYLAEKYNIDVRWDEMIMGALLHDYFLYDWHDRSDSHKRPHGFYHPTAALNNAMEDFSLTSIEKNIIKCHMFPLTIMPPKYKEGWIVCLADKICSVRETVTTRE